MSTGRTSLPPLLLLFNCILRARVQKLAPQVPRARSAQVSFLVGAKNRSARQPQTMSRLGRTPAQGPRLDVPHRQQ